MDRPAFRLMFGVPRDADPGLVRQAFAMVGAARSVGMALSTFLERAEAHFGAYDDWPELYPLLRTIWRASEAVPAELWRTVRNGFGVLEGPIDPLLVIGPGGLN